MELPNDPVMLLSYINMKLRDFYPTLDALCEDLDIDRKELEEKLGMAGYEYSAEANKFWWANQPMRKICFKDYKYKRIYMLAQQTLPIRAIFGL